jgi:rSAM/selenodomain-associated transferase 1
MSLAPIAFVVISKYPTPGRVKTRLTPELSPEQAAAVHRTFLLHLVRRLGDLAPAELFVCYDPPDAQTAMADLLCDLGPPTLLPQVSGDLGHRLAGAAGEVLRRHGRVVIVAVDSPDLPDGHLRRAADMTADADVSLGLASDGGYWCLGLRAEVNPEKLLHGGIDWSTDRAAAQTLRNARALGYRTLTDCQWDDVDQPEDLRCLLKRLAASADAADARLLSELRRVLAGGDRIWGARA